MQFILTGFRQDVEFRVFAFQGIAEDRSRTEFTVRVNLGLIRKYGIRMQELPLECRRLLEREDEGAERDRTFTEDEMNLYSKVCEATRDEAKRKSKSSRRAFNGASEGSADSRENGDQAPAKPAAAVLATTDAGVSKTALRGYPSRWSMT